MSERERKAVEGGKQLLHQLHDSTAMLERMAAGRTTAQEPARRMIARDIAIILRRFYDAQREATGERVQVEHYQTNIGLEQIRLTIEGVAYHLTVTKART